MLAYHCVGRNLAAIAENIAMGVFLGNKTRRQLVSAYLANNEKRRLREMRAFYANFQKEQKWDKEDLRLEAVKNLEEKKAIDPLDAEKWIEVYKFKFIVVLRTIVRLKLYQTALCVTVLPALSMTNFWQTEIGSDSALAIIAVNFYLFVMSIVVGVNAQRAVGILYINENKDKVRVAQLTFFGHRVDSMYDLNDIMHVADTGQKMEAGYVRLVRYTAQNDVLIIFPKYGKTNYELLKEIVGELPKPPPRRLTKTFWRKAK